MSIRTPLQQLFRGCADTYVSGDLLLYFRKKRPAAVGGAGRDGGEGKWDPGPKRSYVLREEGRPPDFVVEVHSPDSREYDRGDKRELYASLGVREYFGFDLLYEEKGRAGDLRGYRLWGRPSGGVGGAGRAEERGAGAVDRGRRASGVRVRDLRTGQDLPWFDKEAEARQAAEARVAHLEALLRDANALPRKPVGQ